MLTSAGLGRRDLVCLCGAGFLVRSKDGKGYDKRLANEGRRAGMPSTKHRSREAETKHNQRQRGTTGSSARQRRQEKKGLLTTAVLKVCVPDGGVGLDGRSHAKKRDGALKMAGGGHKSGPKAAGRFR